MQRQLPPRPSLEQLKNQAKTLLKAHRAADPQALDRIRESYPRLRNANAADIANSPLTLAGAQLVIANEYGFATWARFKAHIVSQRPAASVSELVESLREAAGRGDLESLTGLLDDHPELIDEPGGPGVRTALHQAVFGKSEAAVRLLLERGANPNIRCEGDNAYPLHFAVEQNLVPIIHLLVEHGADTIGEGDYHELGVLGWASAWPDIPADPETVRYLLAHGAQHNIFSAVAMGDTEAIRDLIRRTPGDLEKRMNGTKMRSMPLHLAVLKKQMGSLVTLLDLGANPESLAEAGLTALDLAALIGETDAARMLLDRGAKLRLPAAIALGRTRDVERLLARDPDALKPGCRWGNLIVRAAECSSGEVVEALIAAGASVNIKDDPKTSIDSTWGYTPLHGAGWYGNLSAIEVLMRHGADVTARETKYHGTPAGWADYSGHKEARDLILQGPIDVIEAIQYDLAERVKRILDEDPSALERPFTEYGLFPHDAEAWHTPLAYAAARGQMAMARLLLDRGANAALRSPEGQSIAEIATRQGQGEIAAMLADRLTRNS